ncbi:glycosyltransferase family 4 protein [Paenibacillus tritici]|uniref:Glycosyltransferase family 4 protein n=1 Tax=Paenibacillus tritici TaxID=1873425 RepID=A0ABX2DMV6_9BACL|nr:glycosyltransferase family 4 protein [Paenibacillus tritici]NQX45775.1 glycosyltransferase family 4 protein [Paenibacillus tritici]QUL53982.1 glycosyltransferase family 4 protein [Paenibacillus tritici]
MRLTFPALTLSRGGAQRMLTELANRLAIMGHKVVVLIPSNGVVEYEMKCPIITAPRPVLSEEDFPYGDVIISNYYTTVPVAERASQQGKGLHIRLALCYEPTFLPDNNLSFSSYSITRNLLVLSRWQQEIIRMNHGIKGRIVPVGVNPDFNNTHLRDRADRPLIISAIMRRPEGGFSGHREQEYLIEQLDRVKRLHPEVIIYIIVPPAEYAASESLQELLSTRSYQLRTPGNDVELAYHYNESDIFVSSSTNDAGSLPGLEAMRCGAALVTVYSGGNLEYCAHGHNCLMSYRHENRLAADIVTLIDDKELRCRLAARGELDSQRFTWERSMQIFQTELFDIVSKQGAR